MAGIMIMISMRIGIRRSRIRRRGADRDRHYRGARLLSVHPTITVLAHRVPLAVLVRTVLGLVREEMERGGASRIIRTMRAI